MIVLKVPAEKAGDRLDVWLAGHYPSYSRSFLQKWVRSGRVTLRGQATEPSHRLKAGESFEVVEPKEAAESSSTVAETETAQGEASGVTPRVLYEDQVLLVLDKPAGLVVHPAPSYRGATLTDWLKRHLGGKVVRHFTDPERLGLVHRLDKDTSGVLVVAKSVPAQIALTKQFRDRTVQKTYAAWVQNVPQSSQGFISAPIGRSRKDPTRMAVTGSGRASETSFEVQESLKEVALLSLHPKTGRTHQIRVHVAALGCPIVGDRLYGADPAFAERFQVKRPLLHAQQLELNHPETGERQIFKAPTPRDFRAAGSAFRKAFAMLVMGWWVCTGSRAQENGATKSTSSATHSTAKAASASAASIKAVKKDMASMKDQLESFQSDLSSLKDQLAGIEAGLTQLDAARRLRDLERALPDMNAKLATATSNAEEARSQAMDASRKSHSQQETLESLRDQLDRLQRQSIQLKAQLEGREVKASDAGPIGPADQGKGNP